MGSEGGLRRHHWADLIFTAARHAAAFVPWLCWSLCCRWCCVAAGTQGSSQPSQTTRRHVVMEPSSSVEPSSSNADTIAACSLVLMYDGAVFSFGSGDGGQLEHGDEATQRLPKVIAALRGKRALQVAVKLHLLWFSSLSLCLYLSHCHHPQISATAVTGGSLPLASSARPFRASGQRADRHVGGPAAG